METLTTPGPQLKRQSWDDGGQGQFDYCRLLINLYDSDNDDGDEYIADKNDSNNDDEYIVDK